MIEIDETDLLGFFEVPPKPAPKDQREFFGPMFVKTVDGLRLSVTFDVRAGDLYLEMANANKAEPCLRYRLNHIESATIETDQDGRQWLRAVSAFQGSVGIAVVPIITVNIEGSRETA